MASPNMAKLKAMVHYAAANIPESQLGKTKLNKILWFSDREAYIRLGKTISGDTYIRMPRGPVAASLDLALNELSKEGALEIRSEYKGEYSKYTFHSLTPPPALQLPPEEAKIFLEQLEELTPLTAKEVSERSHDYTWQIFENGEPIDMVTVLLTPGKVTAEMLAWAKL